MRKIFLSLICLFFFFSQAMVLKGGVSEEIIPKGFFGSWGVISKLQSTNNEKLFNYESKDIWTLGGYSNILILQNLKSGAYSEILIDEKPKDGKTLSFEREKTVKEQENQIKYIEKVTFTLQGNNFSGIDEFIVEKYDKSKKLIEKNIAKYRIEGVKISS